MRWPARTTAERFWSHVNKNGPMHPVLKSRCWEWQAYRMKRGYGKFMVHAGKPVLAHRFAYELTHGPLSPEVKLCHSCDNPPCVRPIHTWEGDDAANLRDMTEKGRRRNGNNARTHCRWDHPLSGENLHINTKGERICRICARARDKRRRAKARGVVAPKEAFIPKSREG